MADPRTITATLLVNFGEAAAENDLLIAEVDSRPDGLNSGKTRFAPGEDVFILVYKGANVTIEDVVTSAGNIIRMPSLGPQITDQEEDLVFANEREARVNRPVNVSGFTHKWIGNDLGAPLLSGESKITVPEQAADPFIGIARIEYKSSALVYKLTNTKLPYEDYQIGVFFTGIAK